MNSPDAATAPRPVAGTEAWVRDVLRTAWDLGDARVCPFGVDGAEPVSHTAHLWRVGTALVLKVQPDESTARDRAFSAIKYEVLLRCAHAGVPFAVPRLTVDGRPALRRDGAVCELMPLLPGTARPALTAELAEQVMAYSLTVREVLDAIPDLMVERLAPLGVPPLVEEPRWEVALEDGLERLLPAARARADRWGHAVVTALEALRDARPLLRRLSSAGDRATPAAVIHGDLHRHHFLVDDRQPPAVTGVLDFDNVQLGDPLLDLAWTADTAARIDGTDEDRRRYLVRLFDRTRRSGVLAPGEQHLLMPVLLAHATPVLVDIAKDVCDRGLLDEVWFEYLDLLSPARMSLVDQLIHDVSTPTTHTFDTRSEL